MTQKIDIMIAIMEKKEYEIKKSGAPDLIDETIRIANEKRMSIDRPIKVDPLR